MTERLVNPSRWPSWWPAAAVAAAVFGYLMLSRRALPAAESRPPRWLCEPYPSVAMQKTYPSSWQVLAPGRGGIGIWGCGRERGAVATSAVPFDIMDTQTDYATTIARGLNQDPGAGGKRG